MIISCLVAVLFAIVFLPYAAHARCSRLPSGKCWVNCIEDVFQITCYKITAEQLQNDLRVFSGTTQLFRLYLTDSPEIDRLSADVFNSVASQVLVLDLQDVSGLSSFPELNGLSKLHRFSVWNSPKLCNLALELLPVSMWKVALSKVGISNLENDFMQVPKLPGLEVFILRNVTIKSWRPDFLKVFPHLTQLEIVNSTIDVNVDNHNFTPHVRAMERIVVADNNITTSNDSNPFLLSLLRSMSLSENGTFDLHGNNYTLTEAYIKELKRMNEARVVNLFGNRFTHHIQSELSGMFREFNQLDDLDLGKTSLPLVSGILSGLPNLRMLHRHENNLRNLKGELDIFQGFRGVNLSYLDLANNQLEYIPNQESFLEAVKNLVDLNLRGNRLQHFLNPLRLDEKEKVALFTAFPNVKSLNLGDNQFEVFYGGWLRGLTSLERLNISCNPLRKITKESFIDLPNSVLDIDMSTCIKPPSSSPDIDLDAFTTLPPNLQILRLNSGAYKKWIFLTFNFSTNTSSSLREIHLQDNEISYVDASTIANLPNLEVLNLAYNAIQSIGPSTFINAPNLKKLSLAGNRMIYVGATTFSTENGRQLLNLEHLDLSDNQITDIAPGALDDLSSLRVLNIGWNPVEVQSIFVNSASNIEYLGIQGYQTSCLTGQFFGRLKRLKYLFGDQFNFLRINPDQSMYSRDPLLLSMVPRCEVGQVTNDAEIYPGLSEFISVTVHDSDTPGNDVQYPVIIVFMPLNYCPLADYVAHIDRLICTKAAAMAASMDLDF